MSINGKNIHDIPEIGAFSEFYNQRFYLGFRKRSSKHYSV